ncbi:MAG: hypothetical protein U1B77_00825, partial [Dehalococcoidales bacterium]|nr:hypothetical protein [Dehalococcoidales bacterium]
MSNKLSGISWRRRYPGIMLAVALVLVSVPLFPPAPVQAGTPDDAYTIERYYTENANEQSTTSTTYQDALTLTFTPPVTKDYLVIATALNNNSSTSYATVAQFTIDGT